MNLRLTAATITAHIKAMASTTRKALRIKVSPGNGKVGKIPNVSLPPVKACPSGVPCAKAGECYALKAWQQYPGTRTAWSSNLDMYREDPTAYFAEIAAWLQAGRTLPRFFRWHVAGDILDPTYLDGMVAIAEMFPGVNFLAFTKRHDLVASATLPDNLVLILSMWPGFGEQADDGFRRAWVQDGTEDRAPVDALECPGTCETCGMCWNLPKVGLDVVFHKH